MPTSATTSRTKGAEKQSPVSKAKSPVQDGDSGQGHSPSGSGSSGASIRSTYDGFNPAFGDTGDVKSGSDGDGYLAVGADAATLPRGATMTPKASAGGDPEQELQYIVPIVNPHSAKGSPSRTTSGTGKAAAQESKQESDESLILGFESDAGSSDGETENYADLGWGDLNQDGEDTNQGATANPSKTVVVTGMPASDDERDAPTYESRAADPAVLMAQAKRAKGAEAATNQGRGRAQTKDTYAVPVRAAGGRGRGRGTTAAHPATPVVQVNTAKKKKTKKNPPKGGAAVAAMNPMFGTTAEYVYSEDDLATAKAGGQRPSGMPGITTPPAAPPRTHSARPADAPSDDLHLPVDEATQAAAHGMYAAPEAFKPYHKVLDQLFLMVRNDPDAMRAMIDAEIACRGKGPQEYKSIVDETCKSHSHFVRDVAIVYASLAHAWSDCKPGLYMQPSQHAMQTYDLAAGANANLYEVASAGGPSRRAHEAFYDTAGYTAAHEGPYYMATTGPGMTGTMNGMQNDALYDLATTQNGTHKAPGASTPSMPAAEELYTTLPDEGMDPDAKAKTLQAAKEAAENPFLRIGIEKGKDELWKAEIRDGLVKMIEGKNHSIHHDRELFMQAFHMCLAKIRKAQPNWPQSLILVTAGQVLGKLLRDPYFHGESVVCEKLPIPGDITGTHQESFDGAQPLNNYGVPLSEWQGARNFFDDINHKVGTHRKFSKHHRAIMHTLIAMWADVCQQGTAYAIALLSHKNDAYIALTREHDTLYMKIDPANSSCAIVDIDKRASENMVQIGNTIDTKQHSALPGYSWLFPMDDYLDLHPEDRRLPRFPAPGRAAMHRNPGKKGRPFEAQLDKQVLDALHDGFAPITAWDAFCRIITNPTYICMGVGIVAIGAVGAALAMGGGGGGGGNAAAGVPGTVPVAPPVIPPVGQGLSSAPSFVPSFAPSVQPSLPPSASPSTVGVFSTSAAPFSFAPVTSAPVSAAPVPGPAASPTFNPTANPSRNPTADPTHEPTANPSNQPSPIPSHAPSHAPSHTPSATPTHNPSHQPTSNPTDTTTGAPVAAGRVDLGSDSSGWDAMTLPQQNALCRSIYGGVGGSLCTQPRNDHSRCCELGGCGGCPSP